MHNQSDTTEKKSQDSKQAETDTLDTEHIAAQVPTPTTTNLMAFEGFEHRAIGNKAMAAVLQWYNTWYAEQSKKDELLVTDHLLQILTNEFYFDGDKLFSFPELKDEVPLTAGEIVALAGDFLAVPNKPICEGIEAKASEKEKDTASRRFRKAYDKLAKIKSNDDITMIKELKEQFDLEETVMLNGALKGILPSEAMEEFEQLEAKKGRDRTFVYNAILSHHSVASKLKVVWALGNYVQLLRYNFDHFGSDAKATFKVGFENAVKQMRKAGKAKTQEEKASKLFLAITRLLFASHFLTDLFAAGHIRTPRRALHYYVRSQAGLFTPKVRSDYLSGMLVHEMHDDDNMKGLHVKSRQPEMHWQAFGDKCYFNPGNIDNRIIVIQALVEALKELFELYHFPDKPLEYRYEGYIPNVDETATNHPPMFAVVPGSHPEQISVRGDLVGKSATERVEKWSPSAVWKTLQKRHEESITKALGNKGQESALVKFFKTLDEEPSAPSKGQDNTTAPPAELQSSEEKKTGLNM